MSKVKEDCDGTETSEQNKEAIVAKSSLVNLRCNIPIIDNSDTKKDSFGQFLTDSYTELRTVYNSCEEGKTQNLSDSGKNCDKRLSKLEENGALTKPEKRRNISLTRNAPPPLIHYLQDKEAPKRDEDNSPPQLLPEVIVTRTKLHKEKTVQQDESAFKASINKNLQKIKRKSWMKYSYNSSLSDDQASNESHDHFLPYTDTSQCSSTASGTLRKGLLVNSEKQKKSKQIDLSVKLQGMSGSAEVAEELPKLRSYNGAGCFSSGVEPRERSIGNNQPTSSDTNGEEQENGSSINRRYGIDCGSCLTETDDDDDDDDDDGDDDDDLFVTPLHVSTGKEERDTIDGIEFLGFETEHDMVEFTKIEMDYFGGGQNEENVAPSDDGLEMMDESYNCSESEAHTSSQAIIPTKTKDITKIKGWRTKNFAINNNPSDGQCSNSSIGPYEDDDGFASCDIKIEEEEGEENASLDIEEQGELWSAGEHDLFVHDDQFPLGNYSKDPIKEDISQKTSIGRKGFESDPFLSFEDHSNENHNIVHHIRRENYEDNIENDTYGTGRYPRRHSATQNKFSDTNKTEELPSKLCDTPQKVVKKRGRKPKTIAEKRLMLQMVNQYKRKRKRGRPKGSSKKLNDNKEKTNSTNIVVYNLRNRENDVLGKRTEFKLSTENYNSVGNMEVAAKTNPKMPVTEIKKMEPVMNRLHSKQAISVMKEKFLLSSGMKIKEVKDEEFSTSSLKTASEERIDSTDLAISKTLNSSEVCILNSTSISTSATDTLTTTTATLLPGSLTTRTVTRPFSSKNPSLSASVSSIKSNACTATSPSFIAPCNTFPSFVVTTTTTTITSAATPAAASTAVSTSEGTSLRLRQFEEWSEGKQKRNSDSVISLVHKPLDKSFEYGLVLTTGVRRPLVPLAMEQLRMLRQNNSYVDEHWARFAASVAVTNNSTRTTLQPNTIVLPVRALGLPFMSFTSNTVPKVAHPPLRVSMKPLPNIKKFEPITGTSVRVRCPRPVTQVGVRTIPSIFKRKAVECVVKAEGTKRARKSRTFGEQYHSAIGRTTNELLKCPVDDEVKKVVEDLVSYVERCEGKDVVIHEEPYSHFFVQRSSNVCENAVMKKKKGPMIRELSRLDVNVIEMWDARNKTCTEEYCKLGCICESLECRRPAIEEHCGKEECMFNCECEPKSYKRGDSRQHTLLSPLTLLTIPQHNRRVLAKEEKEFQQTVIRAKHETIVVGSNGSSRRKREIKLPGRYRDSYVALGKEYGLVDFQISSDECLDPSVRRLARISVVNNRELIQDITPKLNPGVSKVPWEAKVIELKQQYNIKNCSIKLRKNDPAVRSVQENENETQVSPLTLNADDITETRKQKFGVRSRNTAVKSTTLPPNIWYDPAYFAARTAPLNINLLKRHKYQCSNENVVVLPNEMDTNSVIASVPINSSDAVGIADFPNQEQSINLLSTSDLVLDDWPESYGKIESVTTLSVEQFQKGDLSFGIEQFKTDTVPLTSGEEKTSSSSEKTVKGKMSTNISADKIANLLNRKIRELKETGGNVSFPSGNEESIHLLQWPVLKNLFRSESIQLWYFKGGSKLVITSTKLRPDATYVNLNDISEQEHKQLPPIISDLIKPSGKRSKHRDLYALLHFDGKNVELVGTIYKKRNSSDQGSIPTQKSIKLLSESKIEQRMESADTVRRKPIVDAPLLSSVAPSSDSKSGEYSSPPKHSFVSQKLIEGEKSPPVIEPSNLNVQGLINKIYTEKEISVVNQISNQNSQELLERHHVDNKKSPSLLNELFNLNAKGLINQNYSEKEKSPSAIKSSNLNVDEIINQSHVEKDKSTMSVTKSTILKRFSQEVRKQTQTEKEKSSSAKKTYNWNLGSPSSKQSASKISGSKNQEPLDSRLTISKGDVSSVTRIRKLKTVWQSRKVQTASGENVSITLPSCAIDSRWFVLSLSKSFDTLHITSKNCFAKQQHILESIKMASTHGKTVRLPLQVSGKNADNEDPNQPKFGIYAVPNISSYVFIGPYGLNEEPSVSTVFSGGMHVKVNDLDGIREQSENEDVEGTSSHDHANSDIISVLKRLCKPPADKESMEINSWLYSKRSSEKESKDFSVRKHASGLKINSEKSVISSDSVSKNTEHSKSCTVNSAKVDIKDLKELDMNTAHKGTNNTQSMNVEQEKDITRYIQNTNIQPDIEIINHLKNDIATSGAPASPPPLQNQPSLKDGAIKRKSDETHNGVAKKFIPNASKSSDVCHKSKSSVQTQPSSSPMPALSPSCTSSRSKKKTHVSKSSKTPVSSQVCVSMVTTPKSPSLVARWLVPSLPWIGCISCNQDQTGGLFFSHPISGMEMIFSNLESAQLWLDRLLQSAILYLPKQLFVTWSLVKKLENEEYKLFDSIILDGNYMMTKKGIFDIDKLVATEADNYGLKPIEVLRLQDKKCRRDLELGFYKLQKALDKSDLERHSSKVDLIVKAVKQVESLKQGARELDKERRKWKNSKHKSLLTLYNMMKGLPIDNKRNIVEKLKARYDQAETINSFQLNENKDSNDGLTFSMARYCSSNSTLDSKTDESDLDDYLSEYDEEETEDSIDDIPSNIGGKSSSVPQFTSVSIKSNELMTDSGKISIEAKTADDDESVTISVVSASSPNEKEVKTEDEIIVTSLNASSDIKDSVCAPVAKRSEITCKLDASLVHKSEKVNRTNLLKVPQITVKPISALTSPVKTITTHDAKNTHTLCMKRKVTDSSHSPASGELPKQLKLHFPVGLPSPGESSRLPGSESLFIKKYKTIKIDSSANLEKALKIDSNINLGKPRNSDPNVNVDKPKKIDSIITFGKPKKMDLKINLDKTNKIDLNAFLNKPNNLDSSVNLHKTKNNDSNISSDKTEIDSNVYLDNDAALKLAVVKAGESPQVNICPKKSSASTLFLNVLSPSQSKIVPLRVDDKVQGHMQNYGALRVPTNSAHPNRTLKLLRKDMTPVFVKGAHGALPFLVANRPVPSSTISGVLGSAAIQQSYPVLSVKKVSKDSIPPGVEPRPATILPPPLVPITDKKQMRPLSEQTTQLLTAIAPLPTLIKMIDGMPVEKGS